MRVSQLAHQGHPVAHCSQQLLAVKHQVAPSEGRSQQIGECEVHSTWRQEVSWSCYMLVSSP